VSIASTKLSSRRRLIAVAAAALAATMLAGPVHPASAAGYTVNIQAVSPSSMTIVDDESWPWSDEVGTFNLAGSKVAWIQEPSHYMDKQVISRCEGGEVRVELVVNTVHRYPDVDVYIDAYLYEGTSCSTSDLDGHVELPAFAMNPVNINHSDTVTKTLRVDNTDEGGDYATVKLTLKATNN
jgi:hypothetical protein